MTIDISVLLMKTDQVDCYDASGEKIDCAGSGHDGALKQGAIALAEDRFRERPSGIEDRVTGLIWRKKAGLSDFPMTWTEAPAAITSLNDAAAVGPWRLPTRRELFSLISHQHINPALPAGHPFAGVFNGYYWTGTRCARLTGQAWYVHLGGGKVYRGMMQGSYMVWPVSGPADAPARQGERFINKGVVVTDRATGRHWYAGDRLPDGPVPWEHALDAVRGLNTVSPSGAHGWRLPTIRELESLVDDTRHSPALAEGIAFLGGPVEGYWSSTTSIYEPRYAWVLYLLDGALGVGFKPKADFHVTAISGNPQENLPR